MSYEQSRELQEKLKNNFSGELLLDSVSRRVYSIDASIYMIQPTAVAIPRSKDDLQAIITEAAQLAIPIVPRGAGTGISGGCLGAGIVVDCSHMRRILEINEEEAWARCEPGVVQDQLNSAVLPLGKCLGPDTSTGSRATIAGMVANNSAGAHSIRYGKMVDHSLEVEAYLAGGESFDFKKISEKNFDQLQIKGLADFLKNLRSGSADLVHNRFPKIDRRVSGYNLDELLAPQEINLARLFAGSEGSFGFGAEFKVKISDKPRQSALVVLHFSDFEAGLEQVPQLLELKPFSLELIDDLVIRMGRQSPSMRGQLDWLEGQPELILAMEFDGATEGEVKMKMDQFLKGFEFGKDRACYAARTLFQRQDIAKVWKLRKAGLGLLMSKRSASRAVAYLEDTAVPVEHLPQFMKEFRRYLKENNREAGFYGHAGAACLHVRPILNLREESDRDFLVESTLYIAGLLKKFGGALSGEHGDGLTRSWMNKEMFGDNVYKLFQDLKSVFDPKQLMNPGKVVNAQGPLENLKTAQSQIHDQTESFYDFDDQGGISLSLDMCNGNGECKRYTSGTMCPSYQASGNEFHSTRARAQALSSMINEGRIRTDVEQKRLYEILDLCLECKGCKTQCPSQVDMAKMKSEFLYQYHKKHKRKRSDWLFANIAQISKWNQKIVPVVNSFNKSAVGKKILEKLFELAPERELPRMKAESFVKKLQKIKRDSKEASPMKGTLSPSNSPSKGLRQTGNNVQPVRQYLDQATKFIATSHLNQQQVVFFSDTMTEYNDSSAAEAAIQILDALGVEVIAAPAICCGRPMISKGYLDQAKTQVERILAAYKPYIDQGIAIVGVEPSCLYAFKDEYPALLPGEATKRLSELVMPIEQYLLDFTDQLKDLLTWKEGTRLAIHCHCHQKSLEANSSIMSLLANFPQVLSRELDTGCCGMAGAFGYEKDHYEFSMQVGETRLFPQVRELSQNEVLISNGLSCRSQIKAGTKRQAVHLCEFLATGLNQL